MRVYVFQAELLCWQCGESKQDELRAESVIDYGDSDGFPQGPYEASESDTPDHCGACGCFLDNPLTADGLAYVQSALDEHGATGRGNREVLALWARRYGFTNAGILSD